MYCAVGPRSFDPFYTVNCYLHKAKTSGTYSARSLVEFSQNIVYSWSLNPFYTYRMKWVNSSWTLIKPNLCPTIYKVTIQYEKLLLQSCMGESDLLDTLVQSKKLCPIFIVDLLYKNAQGFLDTQYHHISCLKNHAYF